MASIGFSTTSGPGIDVQRIYGLFDFQTSFAEKALQSEQKVARIQAVAQVLSAYVTVARQPPTEKQLQEWVKVINTAINAVT